MTAVFTFELLPLLSATLPVVVVAAPADDDTDCDVMLGGMRTGSRVALMRGVAIALLPVPLTSRVDAASGFGREPVVDFKMAAAFLTC